MVLGVGDKVQRTRPGCPGCPGCSGCPGCPCNHQSLVSLLFSSHSFIHFAVLGTRHRILSVLGTCSTTELHSVLCLLTLSGLSVSLKVHYFIYWLALSNPESHVTNIWWSLGGSPGRAVALSPPWHGCRFFFLLPIKLLTCCCSSLVTNWTHLQFPAPFWLWLQTILTFAAQSRCSQVSSWDTSLISSSLKMTRGYGNAAAIVLCISLPSPLGWQFFRASQEKTGWGHGTLLYGSGFGDPTQVIHTKLLKMLLHVREACQVTITHLWCPLVGSSDFPAPVVTIHCCPSFCLVPGAVMILSRRQHQRGEWGCRVDWNIFCQNIHIEKIKIFISY